MDFLSLLKPKATHSRNGFDLSRKNVFSLKAGQARPCLCVETVPNDSFEIDLASLTRTMTMNTAAFLRGKMRFDFFFVPYSQLWHPFNQFISQRTDKHTSVQKGHLNCPVIHLQDLLNFLYSEMQQTYDYDIFGNDAVPQMVDLLNLLGYGDFRWLLDTTKSAADIAANISKYANKFVNVWRLAAYQHIWYDFYRNKYYDVDDTGGISTAGNFSTVDVSMFNFDDIDCTTFASSVIPCNDIQYMSNAEILRIIRLLQPRFVQWKKDLFTSALPGQQFGVVSSVDFDVSVNKLSNYSALGSRDNWLAGSSGGDLLRGQIDSSVPPAMVTPPARTSLNGSSSFDVLSLRKAEMLQLWKQRTLRAGNMVDDSFKAHYGVEPYYEGDNNVNYLGSFSSTLQVNAVESTASVNAAVPNNRVGELAATGTAVTNGKKINFSPRDFGVIMCIASFLPESEYNANGLEKANTLYEQFDYFTPEFENIGLEAIPLREYKFVPARALDSEAPIGFAPRYWNYKTAVDKCYLGFQNEGFGTSLCAWVAPRSIYTNVNAQGQYLQDVANLYVDPAVLNNIFGITANSNSNTDQFLCNVFFDIKSVRPMSELGLPQF